MSDEKCMQLTSLLRLPSELRLVLALRFLTSSFTPKSTAWFLVGKGESILSTKRPSRSSGEPFSQSSGAPALFGRYANRIGKLIFHRERNGWCLRSAQIWIALEFKAIYYETELEMMQSTTPI